MRSFFRLGGRALWSNNVSVASRGQFYRNTLLYGGLVSGGVAFTSVAAVMAHTAEEDRKKTLEDEQNAAAAESPGVVEKVTGLWEKLNDYINSFLPVTNKKPHIPPPLPPQYRRPFVLVIDLECLVSVQYQAGRGWKTKKRPGTDYFLSVAKNCFEIIVFSKTINSMVGFNMMQKIDLEQAITYKFFDDYDKDVQALNRPLEKVVIMTADPSDYLGDVAENCVVLPEWGNAAQVYDDTTLMDLSIFCSELQNNAKKISDVRTILKTLNNQPKPMLQIYKERGVQQLEQKESMLGSKKGLLGR